jgi:hypothetical protein
VWRRPVRKADTGGICREAGGVTRVQTPRGGGEFLHQGTSWAVQSDSGYSLALIDDTPQRVRVQVAMPTSTPLTVRALSAPTPCAQSASLGGQTISSTGTWQGTAHTQTVTPSIGSYWFRIPPDSAQIATPSS